VHEAEGWHYIVRESYEELLWWLQMPSLLNLAGAAQVDRLAVNDLTGKLDAALAAAADAGYRVEVLVGGPESAANRLAEALEEEPTAEVEPAESATAKAGTASSDGEATS
jgi:hypothetical protein